MNKNAIKKFAIEARTKLLASVTDKAGMLGITEKSCSEPITKGADFEVYQTTAGIEVTLNKRQCEQRRRLVSQIESRGFEAVVEESELPHPANRDVTIAAHISALNTFLLI